jgi:GNAT superfamily N-acetyltransferase
MLGTLPEYRKLGVASFLVDWAIEQADRDKLECFVDASEKGVPVYKKYGFLPEEPFEVPGTGFTCTSYIRPAKK